ncbi:MAG: sodium:solute symporter [Bacteroidales bacterium]|nr:sodium:solute symporter [Bacteroidales bacterium]
MRLFILIAVLVLYFAMLISVGLHFKKKANSVDGFVLGGRTVGPWLSAFTYGTSYFSAVVFVGFAGQFGWKYGLSATWAGIGNAIIGSLLAWIVLGRRTRLMTQQLGSATMPQFFGTRFDSKALKIVASMIIFIFLIPYTASLYNGLSRLFGMAFGIDYSVCIIIMAVITAIYVTAGGYLAAVTNDFIQGMIMLGGIVAVIWAVLASKGGLTEAIDGMRAVSDATIPNGDVPGIFASLFGPDPTSLLFIILLTSLGTWGLPQMVQKFYAIKDEGAIKKGTIISTIFALIVAGGCYFLGGFGRLFSDKIDIKANGYDSIIPTMIEGLNPVIIALVVVLVLAASMSTLSSLVMTSSSTLTLDFLKGNFVKKMDEKKQLLSIRMLIVLFILISAVIALVQYKSSVTFIAQLMGISWGALAGAFLAPFLYSMYWKRTTKASCWVSFAIGVGLMTINLLDKSLLPSFMQTSINCGVMSMLIGLVVVPLVSFITPKVDDKIVENAFSCYKKK